MEEIFLDQKYVKKKQMTLQQKTQEIFLIQKKKTKKLKIEYLDIQDIFLNQKKKQRDIKDLFEHGEEENYYKSVKVGNFWRISCIEYESNGDRKKTQSVEEYLCKIRTCLKDIINNDLKKSDT